MYYNKVEISGVNTSKLKVLKEAEKMALLRKVKQGDMQAREELINGNLRLVLSVIQRFSGRGENADDLFQVGCIGLIKAIDNFDVAHEVKFSTYAVPMIQGELRRYLRDNAPVRVSRSIRDLAYRAMQAKEQLYSHIQHSLAVFVGGSDLVKTMDEALLRTAGSMSNRYETVVSSGIDPQQAYDLMSTDIQFDRWYTAFRDELVELVLLGGNS